MLDIGLPPYLIQSSVLGIMAQRLVRTLCPHCKQPTQISDQAWHELVHPWKADKPTTVFKPVGCLECRDTGYIGRKGIYEMFRFSNETRAMVTTHLDIHEYVPGFVRIDADRRIRHVARNQRHAVSGDELERLHRVAELPAQLAE